jgi:hypothetical protein
LRAKWQKSPSAILQAGAACLPLPDAQVGSSKRQRTRRLDPNPTQDAPLAKFRRDLASLAQALTLSTLRPLFDNHVIELARNAGNTKLVELEESARQSDLTSKGDYKLSYTHYNKLLVDAGLQIKGTHKIGPLEPELSEVGGIFVLEIKS